MDGSARAHHHPRATHLGEYAEARELHGRRRRCPARGCLCRVLGFRNPGWLGAPAHRVQPTPCGPPGSWFSPARSPRRTGTSPSALRFIVEGAGDVKCEAGRDGGGRLPSTPNGHWHEHGHLGDGPGDSALWPRLALGVAGSTTRPRRGGLHLQQVDADRPVPLLERDAGQALGLAREGRPATCLQARGRAGRSSTRWRRRGDPFDDIVVEYRNPISGWFGDDDHRGLPGAGPGGGVYTASAPAHALHRLPRGPRVSHSVIAGERVEWAKGDTIAVPLAVRASAPQPLQ